MRHVIQAMLTTIVCSTLLASFHAMPDARPFEEADAASNPAPALSTGPTISAPRPMPSTEPSAQQSAFLDELAKDTWNYLHSDWATSNHLPWSWRSATLSGGDYANTAEIGFYALSWLAAYDLQRPWSPSWTETEAEVNAILDQLRAWQTGSQSYQPHGPNAYQNSVFYQWYWISWTPPVLSGDPNDDVVPSIDNAWLAACLITMREYAEAKGHAALAQKADDILADMDFMLWYHSNTHRFSWGDQDDPQGGSEADYYSNENRIINFVACALGQLSADEFQLSLEALEGPSKAYDTITVEKTAWDGSYFTYTTPALFVREMNTSYGTNTIIPATQAQIAYAQDQGYDAWGFSDCYDVGNGGYVQQGALPVAKPGSPETRPGLVTPHASTLALNTPLATEAITNLQTISNTFSCAYDPAYGFHDSVMTRPAAADYGQCSNRFSALEQEWIFLSIVNDETGFVSDYFYRDAGVITCHVDMYGGSRIYLPIILKQS